MNRRVSYKGRKITLGECKFVFERVWRLTVDTCNKEIHDAEESLDHIIQSSSNALDLTLNQ